jgi:hypothetical protein
MAKQLNVTLEIEGKNTLMPPRFMFFWIKAPTTRAEKLRNQPKNRGFAFVIYRLIVPI